MSSLDRFIYELQAHTSRYQDANDPPSISLSGAAKEPGSRGLADGQPTLSVTDAITELLARTSNEDCKTLQSGMAADQSNAGNIHEKRFATLQHLNDHLETINANKDGLRQELKQQSRAAHSLPLDYKYLRDFTSLTKLLLESSGRGDPREQLGNLTQDATWRELLSVTGNICQELQAMEQHLNSVAGDFSQLSKLTS